MASLLLLAQVLLLSQILSNQARNTHLDYSVEDFVPRWNETTGQVVFWNFPGNREYLESVVDYWNGNPKDAWSLIYAVPLCCVYAGATTKATVLDTWALITSGHKIDRIFSFVVSIAISAVELLQINVVGLAIAQASDTLDLVSNFISVAVANQCDELLAGVIKIPCPDPAFYDINDPTKKMKFLSLIGKAVFSLCVFWVYHSKYNFLSYSEIYEDNSTPQ